MRRVARVDSNHADIVKALRKDGCLVLSLAQLGGGVPDLLVYRARRLHLLEVKSKGGSLTPDQQKFIDSGWPVEVVFTPEDALFAVWKKVFQCSGSF